MRNKSFGEFVDKKKRDSIKQLGLVRKLLEQKGFKVENFLNVDPEEDPYVFCHSNQKGAGFDGIRIYKIGDDIAFRVQKENKTHPYGSAYSLPVEAMFHDFLSDENTDQKKAGHMVIEAIGKEVRSFFDKSVKAAKEEREEDISDDENNIGIRTSGTDYSALVYSKS